MYCILHPLNITKTSAEAEEFIILENLIYYIKKHPVTETGAKKNKKSPICQGPVKVDNK